MTSEPCRPSQTPDAPDQARARIRLAGPGALVACLPQLVGFPPVESLVLIGLHHGRRGREEVVLCMRLDLDAVQAACAGAAMGRAGLPDAAHPRALAAVLGRNGCDRVLLIVVSEQARAPQEPSAAPWGADVAAAAVAATVEAVEAAGIQVTDSLLVRGNRWWSYRCTDHGCCPAEGTPVRAEDAELFAAERVWAGDGGRALASRAEVVAQVAAQPGKAARALEAALAHTRGQRTGNLSRSGAIQAVAALIERFDEASPAVATEQWVRLLRDLTDVRVRDGCLATWQGRPGERALLLWCAATRIAPPGLVAPPATLAALVAHARGEGTLAGAAIERALADDPDYRLAQYAAQGLTAGISPAEVQHTIAAATADLRGQGEPVLDPRGHAVLPHRRARSRRR